MGNIPTARDSALGKIVRRLVETFGPERIYLFGSAARGDSDRDSDYDLIVVISASDEPLYRLAKRAHEQIWGLGVSADILVWTKDAFDARINLEASLPAIVLREGKLLYAA